MQSFRRSLVRRARLAVEFLEDRCTPAGFAGPLDAPLTVVGAADNRVNVVTAAGAESPAALALVTSPFAADVHHSGFGIYTVTLAPGHGVEDAVAYYRGLPGVIAAEPDYTLQARLIPNDPQFSQLYGMTKISAPAAWDVTTGSGNFVVAIIDTGIDYNHPDLFANVWHNPADAIDGIDNDGNGLVDDHYGAEFVGANSGNPFDDNSHGTHVAGTIGAVGNNAVGVVGVNWGVKIMALKFLSASGSGSTSDAVEALNYAVAHGAKVSNNSWGGGGFSSTMFNAIQAAQNVGHIFVAAAGNSGTNNDTSPSYPASYNLANVVAVASTTSTDAKSSFSSYGVNTVDIAAPGSSIRSTTPNNTYSTFSGTSMATPHVAGAIALMWDANPSMTAAEVIAKLTSSADVLSSLTPYVAGGRRLNVSKMVQGVSPPPPPVDTAGAQVTAAAFSGTTSLSSVRFTFNEAIIPSSFGINDVVSFTGPGGAIAVTGVTAVSGSSNKQFDITFATQTAPGLYSMTIGPDILDTANNPMNQDGIAPNGVVPGDQFTATRTLSTSGTFTFDAGGLPLPINDFKFTKSTITINQSISISDVNARINATHTWDGDLVIRLIGPGGQSSTLSNRRGGSGNNFTNTTFDDEAGTAIASGAAPFSGTYRPDTTLTAFDGKNAQGTWTLEVYDAAGQDFGSLTAFTLIITGTNGQFSAITFGFEDEVAIPGPITPVVSVAPIGLTSPATETPLTPATPPATLAADFDANDRLPIIVDLPSNGNEDVARPPAIVVPALAVDVDAWWGDPLA